jgi:hypothetical protein
MNMESKDEGELEIVRPYEPNFSTPQYRAVIRDTRLSLEARALLWLLSDLPKTFKPKKTFLYRFCGIRRTKLERISKELRKVGALSIETIQLDEAGAQKRNLEADEKGVEREKRWRAGQIVGSRWVLKHPRYWALEAPLRRIDGDKSPSAGKTGAREDRLPESPSAGQSATKVHQVYEGSDKKKQEAPKPEKSGSTDKGSRRDKLHGMRVWRKNGDERSSDDDDIDLLIDEFGLAEVKAAAAALADAHPNGVLPYPSEVEDELRRRTAQERRRQDRHRKLQANQADTDQGVLVGDDARGKLSRARKILNKGGN